MPRWGKPKVDISYEGAEGYAGSDVQQAARLLPPLSERRVDPQLCRGRRAEMDIASGSLGPAWPAVVGGKPSDHRARLSSGEVRQMVKDLECSLPASSVRKAAKDQHSKRQPIACGVQLLSGHSCSYACRYCYIQDWYAFVQPAPTELSGTEVLLALLYNSNWIPSRDFIILGDVCDPFHQNLRVRTMEYIRAVAVLGSPIQFSTKSFITKALCAQLAQWSVAHQCPINGLVTCTTLRHVQQLEPEAPPVEQRMETIRNLSSAGLSTFLFLRPLLPLEPFEDFEQLILAAKAAGAEGVVVGSLRVSRKIYRRLKQAKVVNMERVDELLAAKGQRPEDLTEEQVDIQDEPLRRRVTDFALQCGLAPVRRACCANALGAQMPCRRSCVTYSEWPIKSSDPSKGEEAECYSVSKLGARRLQEVTSPANEAVGLDFFESLLHNSEGSSHLNVVSAVPACFASFSWYHLSQPLDVSSKSFAVIEYMVRKDAPLFQPLSAAEGAGQVKVLVQPACFKDCKGMMVGVCQQQLSELQADEALALSMETSPHLAFYDPVPTPQTRGGNMMLNLMGDTAYTDVFSPRDGVWGWLLIFGVATVALGFLLTAGCIACWTYKPSPPSVDSDKFVARLPLNAKLKKH
ncbi:unnamed protein product [Effrenium voratum]|nr:unnamed protein product [Effrenium voratum]